jgi:hypothetical protein
MSFQVFRPLAECDPQCCANYAFLDGNADDGEANAILDLGPVSVRSLLLFAEFVTGGVTMIKHRSGLVVIAFVAALIAPANAQAPSGVRAGMLSCELAPSIGLILGSHQSMTCRFSPDGPYPPEIYVGAINTVGLDIGITAGGRLAWAVFAPTAGALAGLYVGASGEIGVGVGVGANVLFGGNARSIALQPLSVSGRAA